MKKIYLLLLLTGLLSINSGAAVFTVQSGTTSFSPSLITIAAGDTVNFLLGSTHDAREVSQATWNANQNTALAGGFQTAFGGGTVLPTKLNAGTHYYVCTPHVQFGMKGRIVVQGVPSGLAENTLRPTFSVYPNPSTGKFRIDTDGLTHFRNFNVDIYNVLGKLIYSTAGTYSSCDIDLQTLPRGIYIVKISDEDAVLTRRVIIG